MPLTAFAIAAPIVGGIMGNEQASSARADQRRAYQNALAQFAGLSVPELENLDLANLQNAGLLNNINEQDILMGPSAAEGIILDPVARARQEEAMQMFAERAQTGLTPADMAQLGLIKNEALGAGQAKQGQILQEMQSRGMGGSGAELVARLQSSQMDAQNIANMGMQQAIQAQQAREAATREMFSGSSQMRGQDAAEQQYLANARDNIAQINNAARIGVQQRNVAGQNQANYYNTQNAQRIADSNAGFTNQERMYNTTQLPQQRFNNQMSLASARAGANTNYGNQMGQQAAQTAGMYATIGQGIGSGIGAYNQQQQQQSQWSAMMDRLYPKQPTQTTAYTGNYQLPKTDIYGNPVA